jgi:competence protein ComEC
MRFSSVAFLAGILILEHFTYLPDSRWAWLLLIVIPLTIGFKSIRIPLLVCTGFLWALFRANLILSDGLQSQYEGVDLIAEGMVISVPAAMEHGIRFNFQVSRLLHAGKPIATPGRVRLSWYGDPPPIKAGEAWRLQVRLKRPNGFMNPGGFDYEGWLFQNKLRATGYVRKISAFDSKHGPKHGSNSGQVTGINQRLSEQENVYPVLQWRQALHDVFSAQMEKHPFTTVVEALAIGERHAITPKQWEVFLATGTNHLIAISGLHIGLVAGFVFLLVRWLWSLSGRLVLYWPTPRMAALCALFAALVYAALAGFSIPTQRALIMVAVVMVSVLSQTKLRPSHILAVALFLVLLVDPFASMAAGFWLSFAAVAIILFTMTTRTRQSGLWWQWGRMQWVIAVGLLPLVLMLFQRTSIIAPIANLIAVPWMSLVSVPLTLLGSVSVFVFPAVGTALLHAAAWSITVLWPLLVSLATLPIAQWSQHTPPVWTLVTGIAGALWLLMPRGIPARWIGIMGLLPMLFISPPRPNWGGVWLTLLDVGQGLAAVVRTADHVLVYDTGPRFSTHFDTGKAVVVPFLREQGVAHIDTLLISHGDNDHIGGAQSIMEHFPVQRVISGVAQDLLQKDLTNKDATLPPTLSCTYNQNWQWDGVRFDIVYPPPGNLGQNKANNGSCVLRIKNSAGSVLLTGDIEKFAENYLLEHAPRAVNADILVVPHHGSETSSTWPFVRAVRPKYALFPVGYRNRFGFPKAPVIRRYERIQAKMLDTARHGAIQLRLTADQGILPPETYRQTGGYYWTRQ